jgi:hypothetical protein
LPDTCGFVVIVGRPSNFMRGDPNILTADFVEGIQVSGRVYHKDRLLFPMKRIVPARANSSESAMKRSRPPLADFDTRVQRWSASHPSYSYAGTMGKLQAPASTGGSSSIGCIAADRTTATAGAAGCDDARTRAVIDPRRHPAATFSTGIEHQRHEHPSLTTAPGPQPRGKDRTIDPFRSPTAARSDWWIPIRPGTDGAPALGMMHIIFREGWEDRDYLAPLCLGSMNSRPRPERLSDRESGGDNGHASQDIETLLANTPSRGSRRTVTDPP